MTTIQEFSKAIEEKQKQIYSEISEFILSKMGNKKKVFTKIHEIYLPEPDINGELSLIYGIQKNDNEINLILAKEDYDDEDLPDFKRFGYYSINNFLVEDVLNVISNCFE